MKGDPWLREDSVVGVGTHTAHRCMKIDYLNTHAPGNPFPVSAGDHVHSQSQCRQRPSRALLQAALEALDIRLCKFSFTTCVYIDYKPVCTCTFHFLHKVRSMYISLSLYIYIYIQCIHISPIALARCTPPS